MTATRSYKVGDVFHVAGMVVERIGPDSWAVRLPDGEWCEVSEDADGPLGHPAAVEAVYLAEMGQDLADGLVPGR